MSTVKLFCDSCGRDTDHSVMGGLDADGPSIYGYVERFECLDCGAVTWLYYSFDDPDQANETHETWYYRVIVGLEEYDD